MSTKKCLHTPYINRLTKAEGEVLNLITEEKLNIKQIQIRRGNCSRQAVYKIVRSLKKKGTMNLGLQKTERTLSSCQSEEEIVNQVRLHGQEFNIKIIRQDQNYQKLLKKSNIFYLEGHTIKLYKDSIEIYSGEGASFYGADEQEADGIASEYWQKFFIRLENELKVILIKERSRNIKEVNHHYARGKSEICENTLKKEGKHIRVFCPIDGKLAFITDESFGDREDETVHHVTAKYDRGVIDKHINDWRLNNPPTLSEVMVLMKEHAELNKETAAGLLAITEYHKPFVPEFKEKTNLNIFNGGLSYIG